MIARVCSSLANSFEITTICSIISLVIALRFSERLIVTVAMAASRFIVM